MKKYLKNCWGYFFLGPLSKLLETIFELAIPLVTARIIDVGLFGRKAENIGAIDGLIQGEQNASPENYILKCVCLMVVMGICGLFFSVTCQLFSAKCAAIFGKSMRDDIFSKITRLSFTRIDEFGVSSLVTRTVNDTYNIQSGLNILLRLATRAPFLVIGAIIAAVIIDISLSVIFIVSCALAIFVMFLIMAKIFALRDKLQLQLDKITSAVRENFTGVRVIRAFCREDYEKKKFAQLADGLSDIAVKVGGRETFLTQTTFLILNFSTVILIYFGGKGVDGGGVSQGELAALINYLAMILLAVINAMNMSPIILRAVSSWKRVKAVVSAEEKESEFADKSENETIIDEIVLKSVSCTYNNSPEAAVENVSFKVNKGGVLGIIGGTGSGKSTLAGVVCGYYPYGGSVSLNGMELSNYTNEFLTRHIGCVPQKSIIFNATVADNLKIGKPNAAAEEIENALKTAMAWEFVEKLENGIDTVISPHSLSGGQKQRINIARALIREPDVLILDDSASALDTETETRLMDAVTEKYKGKILIIISQRENSMSYASLVINL